MKVLFQSDDYGISEAVSLGILSGIKQGVIRNTGLFVNMPYSEQAAKLIRDIPGISVGIDINMVAGSCVSNKEDVPAIVDEQGRFHSSGWIMQHYQPIAQHGMVAIEFQEDPYPYEQTLHEMDMQVQRFLELMGRKPSYIHPHSLMSMNMLQAMKEIACKYDLKFSMEYLVEKGYVFPNNDWNPKPFPIEAQSRVDVEGNLLKALDEIAQEERIAHIFHCGFVDQELLAVSTYSLIRTKDLYAAKSEKLKTWLKAHHAQLICYDDME